MVSKQGRGSPGGSAGRKPACNAGDLDSTPQLGRSPGEGEGYPLQHPGLENFTDCIVHGVAKSQTRLSDFHFQKGSHTQQFIFLGEAYFEQSPFINKYFR